MVKEETRKILLENSIDYEMRGMREVFAFIKPNGLVEDIALVGFLTHFRSIYEFFYRPGNGTKAHAEHYLKNWKDKKESPDMKKWYVQIQTLSHITYDRFDRPYKVYDVYGMYNYFVEVVKSFLTELPKEYKTEKINHLLEDLRIVYK